MINRVDARMDRFILRFLNPREEQEFLAWGFLHNKNALLLAHVLGGLMYGSFFLVDYLLLGGFDWGLFSIRAIIVPGIIVVSGLFLKFGRVRTQFNLDLVGIGILSVAHAGHFTIGMFFPELGADYFLSVTTLTLLFTIMLCGLQYRVVLAFCLVVLLGFLVKEFGWDSTSGSQQFFHSAIMMFFIIAGIWGGFLVESARRHEFLHLQDLEAQKKDLLFKNKELEQFTYIASHDLQEPLRTVSSFAELLDNEHPKELSGDARQYLGFILQASERMRKLIKGLLDYSRLGRELELAKIDTQKTAHNIKVDLSHALAECGANLHIGSLPHIQGYPMEFRQLLQNLIGNAIKFHNKSLVPEINIEAEENKNEWLFSVSDNGIGIAPEHQGKIFYIYQRLHPRSKFEGTGIGLAHCKKIVELHGGEIWVESSPGKGSKFIFSVPKRI